MIKTFFTLQPYLLGIFYISPSTLCTKLLLYIESKCTYSKLEYNRISYSSRMEIWGVAIKRAGRKTVE